MWGRTAQQGRFWQMTAAGDATKLEPFSGRCVQWAALRGGRGLVDRPRIQGPIPREYKDSAAMLRTSTTVLLMGAAWGPALCGVTGPAFAQDPCEATETGKCSAPDAATGDRFGDAVAIDGNVAVMGAPHDDENGNLSGSVYFFHFDGAEWVPQPKVVAADGLPEDFCGQSVAVDGNVAVLAAPGDDHAGPESGSAYVCRFDGSTWGEEAKLTASDAFFFDIFGESVSVHGSVILVGAPQPLGRPGAAYAYRYNSVEWVEEDILTASDGDVDDQFGISVAVEGNVALVGANHDDEAAENAGAAYIFRFNSETGLWEQDVKLTASDALANNGFGRSVSLSGNVALIGANDDDPQADDSGAAYVLRFNGATWVEEAILTAPAGAPADDDYGYAVSISGDLAVVGAHFDDSDGNSAGAAYLYRRELDGQDWTWNLVAKLTASDQDAGDTFGGSVAIDGGTAFVGAAQDDPGGSTYSFEGLDDGGFDPCACPWDLDGNGAVGVTDFLDMLAVWGSSPGDPADFDGDGVVGITDFLQLLAHWGPCS
jgi:hypothetical protein